MRKSSSKSTAATEESVREYTTTVAPGWTLRGGCVSLVCNAASAYTYTASLAPPEEHINGNMKTRPPSTSTSQLCHQSDNRHPTTHHNPNKPPKKNVTALSPLPNNGIWPNRFSPRRVPRRQIRREPSLHPLGRGYQTHRRQLTPPSRPQLRSRDPLRPGRGCEKRVPSGFQESHRQSFGCEGQYESRERESQRGGKF